MSEVNLEERIKQAEAEENKKKKMIKEKAERSFQKAINNISREDLLKLNEGKEVDIFIDLSDVKLNEGDDILYERNNVPLSSDTVDNFIAGLRSAAEEAMKAGNFNYRRGNVEGENRNNSVRFIITKKLEAKTETAEVK